MDGRKCISVQVRGFEVLHLLCVSIVCHSFSRSRSNRNWYFDEPSCGGEACVVMYHQPSAQVGLGGPYLYQWNDDRCNMKHNFICKYEPGTASPTRHLHDSTASDFRIHNVISTESHLVKEHGDRPVSGDAGKPRQVFHHVTSQTCVCIYTWFLFQQNMKNRRNLLTFMRRKALMSSWQDPQVIPLISI